MSHSCYNYSLPQHCILQNFSQNSLLYRSERDDIGYQDQKNAKNRADTESSQNRCFLRHPPCFYEKTFIFAKNLFLSIKKARTF